jgi:cytochrome c
LDGLSLPSRHAAFARCDRVPALRVSDKDDEERGKKDMNTVKIVTAIGIAITVAMAGRSVAAEGNPERGQQAFRICAACHSIQKGAHRTGPSLANVWGRKAGTIAGFRRYSKALKGSDAVWNEDSLDRWLQNPKGFIPGNRMVFRGMTDPAQRADLIAFLKRISKDGPETAAGMQGGMMGQSALNLKDLGLNNQVKGITHCADTYDITTATGDTHQFWEFNLRFKTDSSENGPPKGAPVIIPGGMRGDRVFIVFSNPEEISPFIGRRC